MKLFALRLYYRMKWFVIFRRANLKGEFVIVGKRSISVLEFWCCNEVSREIGRELVNGDWPR